jgi:catechol 2,3-dioxygenase-like lactoylglutathione lyase family enzyme
MTFRGGHNIAMKVPTHRWKETVAFYEETLGLRVLQRKAQSVAFEFGAQRLWVDRVDHLSRAEVWLEVVTDDLAAAESRLVEANVQRCDAVEALPAEFEGYWIVNPADVVHLVARREDGSS